MLETTLEEMILEWIRNAKNEYPNPVKIKNPVARL
jgi:hypothetical protein